ncbi:MAG: hypothetical protein EZS28_004423 [Streblomastix strix]|uniref:Uncharacterized protein n=1 Tax=Streblomastix strix TaxID=222440 RepID=A0A5J4WYW2_9EUKA|nr:MAG: hypothetical protein EZS28_004422 [Streblomastix strix]KAA6400051.1 MAG: hypothetical protein EZS28_004423 [Streblomastix strix]
MQASSVSSSTSIGPIRSHIPNYSLTHAEARHRRGVVSQRIGNIRMTLNINQRNIDSNHRLVWHSPPLLTKEQCIMCELGETNIGHTEGAQLEHGAIGDNIIVISHKRVAYVLLWHPAIPQLLCKEWPNQSWAPITQLTAIAMGNEGKKISTKFLNQNMNNKVEKDDQLENNQNQRNLNYEQIKLQRNVWIMPQVLTTLATIKGPSQVTSLATSVICGRHFIVVCFENPAVAQAYRLDTNENARTAIIERENMWNFTNKNICYGYGKFSYPFIKRPDMNINTSHSVRVFDVELNDYAHTCVLTTFERHIRKLGSEENIFPDESVMEINEQKLFGSTKRTLIDTSQENKQENNKSADELNSQISQSNSSSGNEIKLTKSNSDSNYISYKTFNRKRKESLNTTISQNPIPWEKQRRCGQYRENDGAVIVIGGQFGQVAFTCIPLAALMLEQAPIDYTTSTESIQAIITRQTTLTTFHFPPLMQFFSMGREPIELIEDNQYIYVKGERTQIMEFNSKYCQIVFHSLSANGGIGSVAPICVDDDREARQIRRRLRKRKQRKQLLRMKYEHQQKKIRRFKKVQKQRNDFGDEENNENIQQQIEQEDIASKSIGSSDSQAKYDDQDLKDETDTLLLPSMAWIGGSTHTLTYGTIDKRRRMNRIVKDLPSSPIQITYLPSLHAIAVLVREQSIYPYFMNDQNIGREIEGNKQQIIQKQTPFFVELDKQKSEKDDANENRCIESDITEVNDINAQTHARMKKKEIESKERICKLRRNYGIEGLGLDISGLANIGFCRETPFRRIIEQYLKKKQELKSKRNLELQNELQLESKEDEITIDCEADICARNEKSATIRTAMMQMSAPTYDTNGIPFTDLAADHYADKHAI